MQNQGGAAAASAARAGDKRHESEAPENGWGVAKRPAHAGAAGDADDGGIDDDDGGGAAGGAVAGAAASEEEAPLGPLMSVLFPALVTLNSCACDGVSRGPPTGEIAALPFCS